MIKSLIYYVANNYISVNIKKGQHNTNYTGKIQHSTQIDCKMYKNHVNKEISHYIWTDQNVDIFQINKRKFNKS